jgi:hypothetical protein
MQISRLAKADERQPAWLGSDEGGRKRATNISTSGARTLTDGTLTDRPVKGGAIVSVLGGAIEKLVRGLAIDLAAHSEELGPTGCDGY